MVFDDAVNKAKNFAKNNSDKVSQGLDSASEQAKSRVGQEHHDKIDGVGDAARDHLGLGDQGGQNQGNQAGGQPQRGSQGGSQNQGGNQGGSQGGSQNQGGNQGQSGNQGNQNQGNQRGR